MDCDDLGVGCSLARCDYIIGGHGDGIAFQELRSSGIDHNDVWLVLTQGVLDIAAPGGVSGDIEGGLTVGAENEAGDGGHGLADFSGAVLAASAVDRDSSPGQRLLNRLHLRKSLGAELCLVFGLAEERDRLG